MDRLSSLPDELIDIILVRLPFIERVRTSTLSSSWRLKWTYHSALFLNGLYRSVPSSWRLPDKFANIVNTLLLQHGGTLKKLSLAIPCINEVSFSYFQPSISYVTRINSLETLSLEGLSCARVLIPEPFALSSYIWFAVNLRHLTFGRVKFLKFSPEPSFEGFPKLTLFLLKTSVVAVDALARFVSVCPQLQDLNLRRVRFVGQSLDLKAPKLSGLQIWGNYIHVSVLNPQNLKTIVISFSPDPATLDATSSAEMFSLISNSLPLPYIALGLQSCQLLGLESMCEKYINNTNMENLLRVKLHSFFGTKIEMKIIQLLLCFSPILEVVYIDIQSYCNTHVIEKVQSQMAIVTNFHRASTKARVQIFPNILGDN